MVVRATCGSVMFSAHASLFLALLCACGDDQSPSAPAPPAATVAARAVPSPSPLFGRERVVLNNLEGTCAAVADFNRDGDLDFLSIGVQENWSGGKYPDPRVAVLLRNDGLWTFSDITCSAGIDAIVNQPYHPKLDPKFPRLATASIEDLDNDGWPDLFLADRHATRVVGPSGQAGQNWASQAVRRALPTCFVLNNRGARRSCLLPDSQYIFQAREHVFGDFDRDGDLDLVLVTGQGAAQSAPQRKEILLHENLARQNFASRNFLQIRLNGTPSAAGGTNNRDGIGAKVFILRTGTSDLLGFQEIQTAFAYRSQRAPIAHFGLGTETSVDVRVVFPDGTRVSWNGVAANQRITVTDSALPGATAEL